MYKMYIFVRKELSKSHRMVQACHSVAEFMHSYGQLPNVLDWVKDDKTMVILSVSTEEILNLQKELKDYNFVTFTEEYYDNIPTALCLEPTKDVGKFSHFKKS